MHGTVNLKTGELLYRYRRSRVQDCGMDRSESDIAQFWTVLNVVMRVHVLQQAGNFMGT